MESAFSKRILIALVFGSINYLIMQLLTLSIDEPLKTLFIFFTCFNNLLVVGLWLHPSYSFSFKWFYVIGLAILYASAMTYLKHIVIWNNVSVFWWVQLQLSYFISLSFYFCYLLHDDFAYKNLFYQAWRILLSSLLAILFYLLVWGLLWLAGYLFQILAIQFIEEVVYSEPMRIIGSMVFLAIGFSLAAQSESKLNKIRSIVLNFATMLYPLLYLLGLGFLIAIPFASKPIADYWHSLYGIIILNLFLFNAMYQSGRKKAPYPKPLNGLLRVFLLALPLYLLLAASVPFHAVWHQDNSVSNWYYCILGGILFLYTLGYAYASLPIHKDHTWFKLIQPVNHNMAIVTAIVFFLMATPVLDLARWVN